MEKFKILNFEALNKYMTYLWCPGKETPLKYVYKLLPGEALLISEGKIKNLGSGITHLFLTKNQKNL